MPNSILNDTKKILGFSEDDHSFDTDLIIHINSAFATLNQLGIGPEEGFAIEDDVDTWDDFIGDDRRLNSVKTYTYLSVRILFDPPTTSFAIDSMRHQIDELAWRINVYREESRVSNPDYVQVIDGGSP